MSGKFKKEVARSMTLSQISCFSGQSIDPQEEDIPGEGANKDFNRIFGSIKLSDSNANASLSESFSIPAATAGTSTMNTHPSTLLQSIKLSNSNTSLFRLEVLESNTHSDYDLDNSIHSDSEQSQSAAAQSLILPGSGQTITEQNQQQQLKNNAMKPSLFKQQFHQKQVNQQLGIQSNNSCSCQNNSSSSCSNSINSSNLRKSTPQGQGEYSQHEHKQEEDNQASASISSSKNNNNNNMKYLQFSSASSRINGISSYYQRINNNNKNFLNSSQILYTSCQLDASCSVSLRIIKENRKNHQQQQEQSISNPNSFDNQVDSINHPIQQSPSSTEKQIQEKILDELSLASVSKMNYVNSKCIQFEGGSPRSNQDYAIMKRTCKYIRNRLRLINKAPFTSVQISQATMEQQSFQYNPLGNEHLPSQQHILGDSLTNQMVSSISSWRSYQSKTPSLIQLHSHFLTKYTLDIDALTSQDICLNTDEAYSMVLPLDAHFQSAILVGTFTGKILLFGLSQQQSKRSKRFVQKLSEQIFDNGVYGVIACQVKAMFVIGGSDGSIVLYDFKSKMVVQKILWKDQNLQKEEDKENKNNQVTPPCSPEQRSQSQKLQAQQQLLSYYKLSGIIAQGSTNDINNPKIKSKPRDQLLPNQGQNQNNIPLPLRESNLNTNSPTSKLSSEGMSIHSIGYEFRRFFRDYNNLEDSFDSDKKEILTKLPDYSIQSVKISGDYLLVTRQSGIVELRDLKQVLNSNNNNTDTHPSKDDSLIFSKSVNNLIKCDFSCDNPLNIITLTFSQLQITRATTRKVLFKKSSVSNNTNSSIFGSFIDFTVNKLTKEIMILMNETAQQTSSILILSNTSTKLRTIDRLTLPYLIHKIELDQSEQNLFCIANNNQLKLWKVYNKNETISLKHTLLDKLDEEMPFELLTTNASSSSTLTITQ